MFIDEKRAQLLENLVKNEPLFDSSINGRETIYEEVNTPKIFEESEWVGIMRNYRRDPPVELSDDQKFDQYQSARPFKFTERKSTW